MNISIIITHYNRDDLTDKLVLSLKACCGTHDINIIVVDNGSEHPYGLEKHISVTRIGKNIGFLKAANMGLRVASGDVKVIISNDVLVSGDFIPALEEKLTALPTALVGNHLLNFDTGWNKFGDTIFPYLEGWFLAAVHQTWTELGGGFDEQFAPNDYEDTDLTTNALFLGFPVVSLNSPYLRHIGAQTLGYSPEREKLTNINKEKFRLKWCSTLINAEGKNG